MKKKCLAVLTVAATLSVASNSFAALAGANTVNSAAIIDGQVKTADLAAGAVTDAKITGPISTSKLNVGSAAGTVAAGNHNHDSIYQKKYGNVVVVATSGGDYSDPIAALNSIVDASVTNPYLVKIMPGTYNCGTMSLQMKAYVDIEGSGKGITTISGAYLSPNNSGMPNFGHSGLINGAAHSELRNISVNNNAIGTNPVIGIVNLASNFTVNNVEINVSSDEYSLGFESLPLSSTSITRTSIDSYSTGEGVGMINRAPVEINESSITATSGYNSVGMYNVQQGQAKLSSVVVKGGHAGLALQEGSSIQLKACEIVSDEYSISTDNSNIQAVIDNSFLNSNGVALDSYLGASNRIANTKVKGAINTRGTATCFNIYDDAYHAVFCQ